MKHITLIAMAALMGTAMQAQVFTSGVEDWTGSVPDDFVGSKTNIAASAVTQVSDNVHGGMYAVRLENTNTSHQRFTTQPVAVTAGTSYDVSFWVRGQGEVRIGLYDGRPGNGYANYNPQGFVDITSNEWQQLTLSIVCTHDTTAGEFIFSVATTVAPEHLVIDDVNITSGTIDPPTAATIFEIQNTTAPDGGSTLEGTNVVTTGVVSGITGTSGYFLQDGSGPWSGVFVFNNPGSLIIGDAVQVAGGVVEFNGQTQLTNVTEQTLQSSGNALVSTSIPTIDGNTEAYESVFVQLTNAGCTASGAFGQFTVNDGSGNVLVDDVIYAYPFNVGTSYDIRGIVQYAFSEWRVLPRMESDVTIATGIGELAGAAVVLYPNPAATTITLDLGGVEGRTEYTMHDATGRMVMADVITSDRSTIDVGALPNGMYSIVLRNGTTSWSTRIAVQH